MKKYVYFFGKGITDGNASMKNLLGGKGANLAEMSRLGIPVPPGFTVTTEVCTHFYKNNNTYPPGLKEQVEDGIKKIEEYMGIRFGNQENPLLFSVRSGAPISMPGMMDTVLNLGLNDETVKGLAKKANNERFAYDCYRRFVQMYGDVVLGLKPEEKEEDPFEVLISKKKRERGVKFDTELTSEDLKELVEEFKELIKERVGKEFPQAPWKQLWGAMDAVFLSWNNRRAIEYRKINNIPDEWGTAVNVQTMVFGNMGKNSGTGVAFTRNPATGENIFYGEYLLNAQGEDVVAGIRTPLPLSKAQKTDESLTSLEEEMPDLYKELYNVREILERHYKNMQDLEFTIQEGKLFLLQTRTGKRTAQANVKIAVDMCKEGLIDKKEALRRVTPQDIDQLLHPMIDPRAKVEVIAKGLPASPGAASGKVVFSAQEAVEEGKKERVILVRIETSPEDIAGMNIAQGVLTSHGGMTSHAAVVARGMGKPCVVGCESISVDYEKEEFYASGKVIKKGDYITIDGSTGRVVPGEVPMVEPELAGEFAEIMGWADEIRKIGVRTNADTPKDAQIARNFGAEGIGLCRTEHMFFAPDRIKAMREMIIAEDSEGRRKALEKILPMQREDFIGIFRVMEGLPVIIRLLDPPLHEFLPKDDEAIKELSQDIGVSAERLKAKVESLKELNPMLGHRGCRLGISYPEITEMQARAIFEAASQVYKEGKKVIPEVMIPLVGDLNEFKNQKEVVKKVADEVIKKEGTEIEYMIGTMIEIPRACVVADEIAKEAEFFSFGTNDLTQMTFGFSRDDVGKFIPFYIKKGIFSHDPFSTLDQKGVGEMIKMGIEKGRKTNPNLEIGICGEHGGDPESVKFCHRVGMNYVSCSPYRVPIARLSAAHAVLEESE